MPTSRKAHACPLLAARFILPTLLLLLTASLSVAAQDAYAARRQTAQRLWQTLQPLVTAHDDRAAREAIAREAEAARALYRELLFESVTSKLYDNPTQPGMEEARVLLAESDAASRALEAKLAEWRKDPKLGTGFTKDGSP